MKKTLTAFSLIISLILIGHSSKAQFTIRQADEEYELYNYSKAVELYLQAYKSKATFHAAQHLANSYRLMNDYKEAEKWYAITTVMPETKPDDFLRYAEVLKNNGKYEEAKNQYIKYYASSDDMAEGQLNLLVASCDSSTRWMRHPVPAEITNEKILNSPKSDWGVVMYNNSIVFTSDREITLTPAATATVAKKEHSFLKFDTKVLPDKKVYGWTGNNYLRLYISRKGITIPDTLQLPPKLFPFIAGTDYHIGSVSFTKDGDEMYFTLTRIPENWNRPVIKTINLEIYSSKKDTVAHKWLTPVPFKYNNAERWSVGDPFITPDGQGLYFVSNMPGGVGGTDIYYCIKDGQGSWAPPVNLKTINTPGNERTPFLNGDNFYFSSDGGVGMGGLDIFKSVLKGNKFGPKHNMGYPINSSEDDFSFITTTNTTGYFASNRPGGVGSDDIYSFVLKPVAIYELEGIVYDKNTHLPMINTLVTLNKLNNKELKVQTDTNGQFNFKLKEKSDYKLRGEKTGYLSDNQMVSTIGIPPQKIKKDLYIEKIELNKAIRIENIYYDFDKSYIRPDAAIELDKLVKILKENPSIHIELGSHTDSRGNDEYNLRLSQRRANAAVEYIVKKGGIYKSRIVARGYGETQLLNRCVNGVDCTPAEHQLNRRTEFKITRL